MLWLTRFFVVGCRGMLEALRSGIARVLLGVTEAPEQPITMDVRVSRLSQRVEEFETTLAQQALRFTNLTAEVEDSLQRATNRYAAARGAETRANKVKEEEEVETPENGRPTLDDPSAYRRWIMAR